MINSVALLFYQGLGLALPEYEQWRSLNVAHFFIIASLKIILEVFKANVFSGTILAALYSIRLNVFKGI